MYAIDYLEILKYQCVGKILTRETFESTNVEIKLQEQIFFVLNQMTSVSMRANCCEHLLKILYCQWISFLSNALDYNMNLTVCKQINPIRTNTIIG